MPTAFNPGLHEALREEPWSPERAVDEARSIFADVCARMQPNGLWVADPNEDTDIPFNKTFYNGAAGTLWGLERIARRLGLPLPKDPVVHARELHEAYLTEPDTLSVVPSFFLGESGIILLRHKLAPAPEFVALLRKLAFENARNPVNEVLWGCPGTMLVSVQIGDEESYLAGAAYLFEEWREAPDGTWRWQQDLYGKKRELSGAAHGFGGNVHALCTGQRYLSEAQRGILFERTALTLLKAAAREAGDVNWPPSFGGQEGGYPLQWCHGAPGMITSLHAYPANYSQELEQLLCSAGETVWKAGPLQKGIGICHGTDGNGFAFLSLYARTRDDQWLARARSFAMHAIGQRNGRSTLWTGEVGLALYLLACVDAQAGFPTLDYF